MRYPPDTSMIIGRSPVWAPGVQALEGGEEPKLLENGGHSNV
jgi:hypothetical protein